MPCVIYRALDNADFSAELHALLTYLYLLNIYIPMFIIGNILIQGTTVLLYVLFFPGYVKLFYKYMFMKKLCCETVDKVHNFRGEKPEFYSTIVQYYDRPSN